MSPAIGREIRADEHSILRYWQRMDIRQISSPRWLPEKIELHIRCVKRGNTQSVRFEESGDGVECMRTGKVTDDRNETVFGLELLQPLKEFFRCQVALIFPGSVGFKGHFLECRILQRVVAANR